MLPQCRALVDGLERLGQDALAAYDALDARRKPASEFLRLRLAAAVDRGEVDDGTLELIRQPCREGVIVRLQPLPKGINILGFGDQAAV